MVSVKQMALAAVTMTGLASAASNSIAFCKDRYLPSEPVYSDRCFILHSMNLGTCYGTPREYAKEGQSWKVHEGRGLCYLTNENNCAQNNGKWAGTYQNDLTQDYALVKCDCFEEGGC